MQPTTELISELVKAANRMATVSESSRARLLDRASAKIRILRSEKGMPITIDAPDTAFIAFVMALSVPRYTDEEISYALLDAAGTIRQLHIDGEKNPCAHTAVAGGSMENTNDRS